VTVYVVDASVALKWFVPEAHSENAERFLALAEELVSPDLLPAEFGNAIRKKLRLGEITKAEAMEILAGLRRFPFSYFPAYELLDAAFEIAVKTDRTVYDSLYVALAVLYSAQLVTADDKFANALRNTPFSKYVKSVQEF
jgi:predicted nucleic acid-binding protein